MVLAALAAWTVFNRVDAGRKATAECNTTYLQIRLVAQQARAEEAERIAQESKAQATASEALIAQNGETANELLQDIQSDANGCVDISDEFRERLLSIRGGSPVE